MADLKNYIVERTKSSTDYLIAAVKGMPDDKVEFAVGGKARNALQLISECSGFPEFIMKAVEIEGCPPMSSMAASHATLDEALAALRESTDRLLAFIPTVPDEKLDHVVTFPWETATVATILGYHAWNNTYHLGQVSQTQLAYGDEEMYVPGAEAAAA